MNILQKNFHKNIIKYIVIQLFKEYITLMLKKILIKNILIIITLEVITLEVIFSWVNSSYTHSVSFSPCPSVSNCSSKDLRWKQISFPEAYRKRTISPATASSREPSSFSTLATVIRTTLVCFQSFSFQFILQVAKKCDIPTRHYFLYYLA